MKSTFIKNRSLFHEIEIYFGKSKFFFLNRNFFYETETYFFSIEVYYQSLYYPSVFFLGKKDIIVKDFFMFSLWNQTGY